jgi:hypothetical protein
MQDARNKKPGIEDEDGKYDKLPNVSMITTPLPNPKELEYDLARGQYV